ncbi:Tfp pilus assembly protein FimT/FimU [Pseudidiomarina halophila]|uniref:Type II secretion system protein H n=1 Tax=Pseudidiomarina halophila TaxID=1449799 RepID=A0A432XWM8_9GAMM|nr:GspH/FimT family pseudopilin [Pseudidiomarina halophila]RUO53136.1 type II secretion system protein GspH [Pseudidiomarina halophila]
MTLATGTLNKTKAGFTLVEIMVTIAIIAVLAMSVTFVIPDEQDDQINETAEELVQRIRYAQEYALVRHAILGLHLTPDGYEFLQWREQQWQPIEQRGLRAQNWPDGLVWEVESETEELLGQDEDAVEAFFAPQEDDNAEPEDQPMPQVWILGSGDISVFTLTLSSIDVFASRSWRLVSEDGYEVTAQAVNE